MNHELAVLFAKRLIQRRDVKAVQFSNGAWSPDRALEHIGHHGPFGFEMGHLYAHLEGKATYGHYLLDNDSNCRMFAFDVDLKKTGFYDDMSPEGQVFALGDPADRADQSLRNAWLDRAHPARPWLKMQMNHIARKLAASIQNELGIPCAAAYSGGKGVHVYGFTGPMPAAQVRAAATYLLESTDDWELERGQHQYRHKLQDPSLGYPNFSIEVFPKQDSLDGKDLGNLMRLPLGRNLKSQDPTFFLDFKTPIGVMAPHSNPVQLLEEGNPFA